MLTTDSVKDFLLALLNSDLGKEEYKIISHAKNQIEDILIADAAPLSETERQIQDKHERVKAYVKRTGCSMSLGHSVVNSSFRQQRGVINVRSKSSDE